MANPISDKHTGMAEPDLINLHASLSFICLTQDNPSKARDAALTGLAAR